MYGNFRCSSAGYRPFGGSADARTGAARSIPTLPCYFTSRAGCGSKCGTHNGASTFLLGPDDQSIIQGPELDEVVNRPYRIDPDGYVSLPMLGKIKAGGMTVGDFETELNRAASKYIRDPQLVASVAEFHSQPISVV